MTLPPPFECIDLNAINLSLADLKRRHEPSSAPYVQAWQDVGLEDDGDASVVRGRRKGPNAVMRVAPERDELESLLRVQASLYLWLSIVPCRARPFPRLSYRNRAGRGENRGALWCSCFSSDLEASSRERD